MIQRLQNALISLSLVLSCFAWFLFVSFSLLRSLKLTSTIYLFLFLCFWLSLMLVSTGERQEWMETLQTTTRPPSCGSQKRSDSLSHLFSTNKRGLLELRSYKGRVLVSLAGSKVRLCKTEQVLLAPRGHPLYRMTASCLKREDNNHSLFESDKTELFMKEMEMFMHV